MTDPTCTCEELFDADDPFEVTRFEVAPRAGGGWTAWGVALGRLLGRLAQGPTQCVSAAQGPGGRYVQWMIGHGRAYVEVSSNHFLMGHHRLTGSDERHLGLLGFSRVDEEANWSREIDLVGYGATSRLGVLLTHLVEDVALFDPLRPVTIEQFLAARPCGWCAQGGLDQPAERDRLDGERIDGPHEGPSDSMTTGADPTCEQGNLLTPRSYG